MHVLIVSCDFKNNTAAETKISGELNKHDGVRFKKDAWILRTLATAQDIYNSVMPHLKPEICIIVAEVTSEPQYHMPQGVASWLKQKTTL